MNIDVPLNSQILITHSNKIRSSVIRYATIKQLKINSCH